MRALRHTRWQSDPELLEVPEPEAGPGQVVIRVGGAGACHSDLHVMHDYPEGAVPFRLPFTLGHENAGWIAEVGAGVRGLDEGQPVAVYGPWGCGGCRSCAGGAENYCRTPGAGAAVGGLGRDGGMADYLLVPAARHLVPLPDGLDPRTAAPLTDAGLTPYHAVARVADLLVPGSTAVVIGAGGLGNLAVPILRATTGAQVIAIDPRADSRELARARGAHEVLDSTDDTAAAVRELTRGTGADVVLDMVGAEATLTMSADTVSVDGAIVVVGIAGGTLPVSWLTAPYGLRVMTTYWGTRPELLAVLALAARGDLVVQTTEWPLSRATEAYAALQAGTVTGRAVVVPDDR